MILSSLCVGLALRLLFWPFVKCLLVVEDIFMGGCCRESFRRGSWRRWTTWPKDEASLLSLAPVWPTEDEDLWVGIASLVLR